MHVRSRVLFTKLEALELHALLAAFCQMDENPFVDLFKKWSSVTNSYVDNNNIEFLDYMYGRYFIGYYYKFVIIFY